MAAATTTTRREFGETSLKQTGHATLGLGLLRSLVLLFRLCLLLVSVLTLLIFHNPKPKPRPLRPQSPTPNTDDVVYQGLYRSVSLPLCNLHLSGDKRKGFGGYVMGWWARRYIELLSSGLWFINFLK